MCGDTPGAAGKSKGTKPGGKGPKQQSAELSPACLWLEAQHDARLGASFLQSITGTQGGMIDLATGTASSLESAVGSAFVVAR